MPRPPVPVGAPFACPCGCGGQVQPTQQHPRRQYATQACWQRDPRRAQPVRLRNRISPDCNVPGLFRIINYAFGRGGRRWVALQLGFDPATIAHWGRGQSSPYLPVLNRLCDLLGATADELMGRAYLSGPRLEQLRQALRVKRGEM